MADKQLYVVVPAKDEQDTIYDVVVGALACAPTVVVDDGSTDKTSAEARRAGATVLHHAVNRGVGAATWTGVTYALSHGAAAIVTLDADGQHQPADIPRVAGPVLAGEADVVIGSRFKGRHWRMPLKKRVGNFILNQLTYWLYGIEGTDTQSGFRCYSRRAAENMNISIDGYGYCSEVMGEIANHRLRYAEVPIETIYLKRTAGTHVWDGFEIAADLLMKKVAG